jgi:hypothetical protein
MRNAAARFPATHEAKLIWMRSESANLITICTCGHLSGVSTDCREFAVATVSDDFAVIYFHGVPTPKPLQRKIRFGYPSNAMI